MKNTVQIISFLSFCIISFHGNSQTLQGSCIKANFGIDGYIYANGSEYVGAGSIINTNSADDWFYNPSIYPGTGINVIDTTGSSYYNSILQSGTNTFFASPMSLPSNSVVAGKRWQDATYARDYFGGTGATDSTSFTSATKNGDPLDDWATGPSNVTPKNDLIDCYSHMRRDGELATSPLWLFLGFSRISSNGESFFDGELFAKDVDYDPVTGFTSAGDEEGHTAWQFDTNGNITEIGDIVVTVNMSTNGSPTFEVRIWVRRFDFENISPATFDFGTTFDGSSNSSVYGYADIIPPTGNEFGCGVTNEKTWVAPPWGTLSAGGNYASFYEPGQFVEIGLNLFEFGIDPQVVEGMDGCDIPFSNILFKSRASNSFTAQLKDFSGPFGFLNLNEVEIQLAADSITCYDPVIPITVSNNFPNYYYDWSTPDGNIAANINDTLIYVDAPGMYILGSAFIDGCELKYDTIYVDAYTDSPPANILSDTIYDCNNVIANLSAADNGYVYSWLGPSNVSYFGQSISVTDPGIYYLYVLNEYGCVGMDSIYVIEYPCQDVSVNNITSTVILDTLPPFFTPPPPITIDCGFDYLDLGITGDVFDESDNCDPEIDAIFTDSFDTNGYCSGTGKIIRNWTLTDDCGNVFSATQEIILIDTIAPVFVAPIDVTINCDADFLDLNLTGGPPIVIDECDTVSVSITYSDSFETDFNCNGQTRIQRIWSAMDDCGNESLDTQMIMMMDTVGPQILGVPIIPFVSCDSVPNAPTVTVIDNCDAHPTVVFTENTASASCPNSYILIRTWTATDNCGNQTVLTQELNVEDISNPTILSFPQDLTVSCDSIPPPFEPIVEDDCDSDIDIDYSEQQIIGNCEGNYELIRMWIWTDDCDNESSAFQTITVQDNTPPTFTVPADVTFDCTVDLNNLSIVGDVTDESDNCTSVIGEANYIDNANYSCVGTGVIERTWSLADACGNLTEYVQTITISDTTPPVFSIPEDITINCHLDENNLIITGDVLNEFDDCDNTLGQATYQDIIVVNSSCSLESNITRIWSLADDCGNITIDTQYIFIVDTIAPTFSMPSDITIDCQVDHENLTIVGEATNGTDNCDQNLSPITYTDIYTADGNCIGTGTIERIWSISDECGNTNIDTQLIILIDTFPPVFSVPADISLDCEQDPNDLNLTGDVIDEFDNCFPNIGEATYVDSILNDTPCEGSMVIFRTWTLEDGCGNITSETQTISVEDTTAPEFSTPPDVTLNCFSELQDTLVVGIAVIINDNCSSTIGNTYHVDSILVNDSCNYVIERHWFAEDICGNVATDTQMIMITDTIAPVLNGNLDTLVIGCDSIPPPATLTATDNCNSSVVVVFSETIIPGGCSNAYIIVRTWTATDRCGNETTYSQNLEVQDNDEPIVFVFPADVTVSCDSIPEVATQNVEDNCTVNITLDFLETISAGACANDYMITRTWTWADNCNNTSTYSQNITVYDNTSPVFTVPADITVDCTTDVNDLNFTGNISNASDNCDTQVGNAVYTDEVFSNSFCGESRLIHRTWSLTDSCGNTLFDLQVITVVDTLLPSFTTPDDVTINCGDDPNDLYLVGDVMDEFDSCTAAIGEATYVDSILVNTPCEGASIIYRIWTLDDDCGNEFQDIQTITILDTNAPIFSNIPLDSTVTCDAVPVAVNPVVTDDCASFTLDYSEETIDVSCPNDFLLRRKWIATDACGNQDSIIQILTVIDTVAPILTNVPVDVTLNCEDLPAVPVLNFTDNCSDTVFVVFSENTNSGACIDIQIVTRNWTATDVCGNETSITQQITLNHCSPEANVTLPPDTTLCEFEPITFEVNMIGNYPSPVYQWQYTTDTMLSWTNIPGATNPTFPINSVTLADSGYYQVLVSNNIADLNDSLCRVFSDITFLEVIPHAPLTNLKATICDGQSLLFNGQNLTTSGQYTANLTAANGCDSTVIIDLVVNPTYELTHLDTICFGENYPFGNNIYSTTGTYSFTFSTINNCDSLVHLELFVYDEIQTNLTDTICDTEILIFNGQNLTTAGQYTAVLTAANGCDSTVIIDFWVNPIYELTHPDTICFGENYPFGNNTYTTTGNHSFTFSTIDGCDSLVHLELFVYDEIQTNLNDTICDGEILIFNSQTLTASGQYTAVLTAANGCDSTVIVDLVVNPTYELTHLDTICFGENYPFGNSIYSTTGTYSFTFSTINNCDSLVHLELFVYDEIQTNLTDTICDTETLIFNGQNLTTAGQYTAVLTAANGCDSTVIVDLWVNPIYELTHPDTICFGENYSFGNNTYTTTGNHSFTFSTIDGCDSLVHLELFVYDEILTNLNDTICDGETLIFNSQSLTAPGQYTAVLTAANGCDSTVIIDLVVNPTYELTHPDTICFGTTYDFGNSTYSMSGTYSFTFSTINGCDSLVHLELKVDTAITTNLIEEICDGENYNFNGEIISISGQYIDTLTAANSCDSFVILDLTVLPVYEIFHADTICEGENYLFGNNNYTTSGSHSFTYQTINGCDSLVHLELVVNDTFIVNMEVIICDGDSYSFGNNNLTQSGVYTDSLYTITGCDSLIILNLTVAESTNETIEIDLCYGESFDGTTYFQTSYLSEFLTNIYGCDSIVHTNIYVSPEAETFFDIDICEGDTYQNIIYHQDAILIDSLMTINGCDSIVITNINVHPEYEFIETLSLCTGTPYQGIVYSNDTVFVDNFQSEWGCDSIVIRQLQIRDELFDSIDVIICLGEMYQGTAYSNDTITTEMGTSVNGCDSTFYTKIDVIFPSDTSIQVEICDGENFVINTTTYSQSGSYTQTIQSVNGCDSTINLELVVGENYELTSVNYICEGDFYNGNQYFTSTVLIDSLTTIYGCDSILIYEINVLKPSTETQIIQICEGSPYQGIVYSNDTTLVDTLQNLGLCDSIVFYNITLVTEINISIAQTLCYGENWNGTNYTSDTIFTNIFASSGGCDSITTTSITVLPLDQDTTIVDLCEGETVFAGGAYQSTNGIYHDSLSSVNGCDSFVTTIVTVYPVFADNSEFDICYGDSLLIFGIYRFNAGNYVQNLSSQDGCDSTISITLNVGPPPANTFYSFYLCEGDSMLVGGAYQTTSGVYIDSLVSSNGCDSLITTTLELVNPIANYQVGSICEGDSLTIDKHTYYSTGNYIDTLTSYTGCDSIVHFQLTVHPVYEFTQDIEICEGETYFVGGALQNSSGIYYDSYSTINGCDSNWITNLLVKPTSYLAQEFEMCEGESMDVGGANQTTSGIYHDVYPNSLGCDSLVMTTLVFHPTFSLDFEITICQNDSIFLGGAYQTTAGIYVDQHTTIQGCDSIITTVLNIFDEEIDYYFEASMCVGDSILIAGTWQFEAGVFVENFQTINGCDSIVTTTLNVIEPNFVIGENAEICFGDEVQLYLEGADGVENITWYPDFSLSCNDCPNPIAYPDVTTTYTVTYPTGCNNEILETEVTVVVIDPAPIELVETELTILEGDTVILMVADADSSFIYTWIDNSGNVVCDTCFTLMVSPSSSISYTVIANDPTNECPDYENVVVNVRPATCEDGTLEVANIIFPQSGGYGELLEIKHDRVEIRTLRIFNRWGELVFETNDVENKWDGTFRGQLLNPAVYVYYIIGVCDDQTKFIYTGNVTLIH